jgi:hypothetical protein
MPDKTDDRHVESMPHGGQFLLGREKLSTSSFAKSFFRKKNTIVATEPIVPQQTSEIEMIFGRHKI